MTQNELMTSVPLTPAEQMLRIRDAVLRGGDDPSGAAGADQLAIYLQSADRTQQRLRDLEAQAWIHETAFSSQAPVIGKLIVAVRNLWNWMSTKWYVLPMLQQQNAFNVAAAQMIRDLWAINRSQMAAISGLRERLDTIEGRGDRSERGLPVDRV